MFSNHFVAAMSPGGYLGLHSRYRVALVLAGCGARDGREITEAVSAMIALSQAGFSVSFFAPERDTFHVINHNTGMEVLGTCRSMLDEAARIARGQVQALSALNVSDFDVLAFSGGFGVAKNLCDFAFRGVDATLALDVRKVLFAFLEARKVICAMCIAPVLLGLATREKSLKNVQITLGNGSAKETIDAAKNWGCDVVLCGSGEACVDHLNKLVSVPAYMIDDASPADIYACARAMVDGVLSILGAR